MNRDNMERWVEALESEEYHNRQCFKTLRQFIDAGTTYYCAMGLGVLVSQGNFELRASLHGTDPYIEFARWLGFDSPDQIKVEVDGAMRTVWILNDKGMTFPEIAQLLRKQFL